MKSKFLKAALILAASVVSFCAVPALKVEAKIVTGWVQACEPDAPVIYYSYDDEWNEEKLQRIIAGWRDFGFDEASIQEEVAKLRVKYNLPDPAGSKPVKAEPTYTQEQIDAAWEEVSKSEATCTEGAKTEYKNSLTGKTKSEETSEPLGHDYTSTVTTEATCVSEGVAAFTCKVCGDSYEEVIPATGHTAGETVVTKNPGAFSEGEETISCTTCGEVLEIHAIPQTFPLPLQDTIILVFLFIVLSGIISSFIMIRKKTAAETEALS